MNSSGRAAVTSRGRMNVGGFLVRIELRSMVAGDVVPWLADTDVSAAYGFARGMVEAPTEAELRRRVLHTLAELVPADVLSWDQVELATGAVGHAAVPAEAEPRGAFDAVVERAADHPLLAAHAARRRPRCGCRSSSRPEP